MSLEEEIASAPRVICLGDITGYHCYVNEVIDFLRSRSVICIQGNHDRYVIEGLECQTKIINDSVRFGIEQAKKLITADNLIWLSGLPTSVSFKDGSCSFLCCHGSPWSVTDQYVYQDSELFDRMGEFAYDVIAMGHTHRAFVIHRGERVFMNPGSVGQARDYEGEACAIWLDTDSLNVDFIRRPYDFRKTIRHSLMCGAGNWIYKHFKTKMADDTF